MDSLDSVRSVFSARLDRRGGTYVLEIPQNEVDLGAVDPDTVYRVAVLDGPAREPNAPDPASRGQSEGGHGRLETDRNGTTADTPDFEPTRPVREDDVVAVTIDDIGDEGDGIARIGAGFVLFVSSAEPGDTVAVEVTAVRDTYAFGDVVGEVDVDVGRTPPTP